MNVKWQKLVKDLRTISEALEPIVVIVSAITAGADVLRVGTVQGRR